jgi:hypothetical protein
MEALPTDSLEFFNYHHVTVVETEVSPLLTGLVHALFYSVCTLVSQLLKSQKAVSN